jgi:anti-anti-sigma regulatory factor
MPVTLDQSRTPCVIGLAGEVNIRCAAELKEVLVEGLALGRGLRVDLTGATEVDITASQLLWAAEREARSADKEFVLDRAMPDEIAATLNLTGLKLPMSAV